MATFDEFPSDELVRRYNRLVCGYTLYQLRLKRCHDPGDHSRDVINQAWLAILRHLDQLEDSEKFEPWVKVIIANLVSQHAFGRNGCVSRQDEPLEPSHEAGIVGTENKIEANLWVDEMLDRAHAWSFMFGEIVRLHLVEGYTLEQVAEKLGQPYAKVRSCYYRNLKEFRKLFKVDSKSDDGGDGDSPYAH